MKELKIIKLFIKTYKNVKKKEIIGPRTKR
jgi:hypothetical protein